MKITFKTILIILITLALLRIVELQLNASHYMKAYLDMGQKSFAQEKYQRAIKYYQKAIKINPNSPQPYYQLALVYEKLNDRENKIKNFEKVVEVGSLFDQSKTISYQNQNWELSRASYEVGMNHLAQENLPMAIRSFELSLKHNEQFTKSYLQLGLIYLQLNQKEKVFDYLRLLNNSNDRENIGELNHAMRTMHPEWWE